MAERLIVDDNGEVLDIVCDHEFKATPHNAANKFSQIKLNA